MKKIYIALAVLATAALVSCEQEKSFNDVEIGENGLVFALQGGASTRATDNVAVVEKGVEIELNVDEVGQKLFLEETIQDLNYSMPATKGTPAYTENAGVLYADNLSVYGDRGTLFTTATTFQNMDDQMYPNKEKSLGDGWRYHHNYSANPWPDANAVGFYLNMPASLTGLSFNSRTGGKFNITYTTPDTAGDQQDILFGYTSINKETHDGYLPNGAPVMLYHALTGVKFAIENYDESKSITIKSISFKGLVGKATTEFTPGSTITWTPATDDDITKEYSSGTFGAPINYAGSTTTTDESGEETTQLGSFTSKGEYPDSFVGGGTGQNNLNDGDATQTFWFIPQAMTNNVKLIINYTFGSSEVKTWTIDFGKEILANSKKSNVKWNAGELRTYTIRIDDVNVMIEDVVSITKSQVAVDGSDELLDSYKNSTKTAVRIKNTGNVDVYIRAALIGQWLDEESGDPVFGYTDFTSGAFVSVDSWYQDQFVNERQKQGKFTGLPGTKWTRGDDGFYYYEDYIAPNNYIPNNLFTTYTVLDAPASAVAGEVRQIYFRLEIATQAISAKKSDGTYYTMEEAWANANTPDPEE